MWRAHSTSCWLTASGNWHQGFRKGGVRREVGNAMLPSRLVGKVVGISWQIKFFEDFGCSWSVFFTLTKHFILCFYTNTNSLNCKRKMHKLAFLLHSSIPQLGNKHFLVEAGEFKGQKKSLSCELCKLISPILPSWPKCTMRQWRVERAVSASSFFPGCGGTNTSGLLLSDIPFLPPPSHPAPSAHSISPPTPPTLHGLCRLIASRQAATPCSRLLTFLFL